MAVVGCAQIEIIKLQFSKAKIKGTGLDKMSFIVNKKQWQKIM